MDVKIIDARDRSPFPPLDELWRHRELIWLFAKRYLASRYRQMALGTAWAVLEPLAQLALMTVVFGFLLRVDTNEYPYAIYVFTALIPWQHFTRTTLAVAGSLQENITLISKVYFPRIVLPIAAVLRELFDTALQFGILLLLAMAFGYYASWKVLVLGPLVLLGISLAGAGLGLWVAAVIVKFRDIRPVLGIVLQAGMYLSPVLYAASVVPERFRFFYQLNPMYWPLETFRWLLLDQPMTLSMALPIALALVAVVFVSGLVVFSLNERKTVDVL
ncbi:ABC transporter permease [Rhodoplanes azumiensis]|uniref:Transport permease protein n=1 Tax=Rhodoplanes azumiensis TaxID=1897628 RepID=A0ABW5AHJ4_9BRAD